MLNDFALKLEEWFKYYDPEEIEVETIFHLVDFTDKIVLEVGCATGKSTVKASKGTKMYFAIDNDIRVIDFCKGKYCKNKNVYFIHSNVEEMLFKSEQFDIVYLPWVINYIEDKEKAIHEIYRVLKPGGKVVLVDSDSACDYNNILAGIIDNTEFITEECYELPFENRFKLLKKQGELAIPYKFPSYEKAFQLLEFIVEEYFEINLEVDKRNLLKNKLLQYLKDGNVLINEKPLFYLFEKI